MTDRMLVNSRASYGLADVGHYSTSGGNSVHLTTPDTGCFLRRDFASNTVIVVAVGWAHSESFQKVINLGHEEHLREERLTQAALKHVPPADDGGLVEGLLTQLRRTTAPDLLDEIEDQLSDARVHPERLRSVFESRTEPAHVRAAVLRVLLQRNGSPGLVLAGLADTETRVREVAADEAAAWLTDDAVLARLRDIRERDPSRIIRQIATEALA